MSDGFRVSSSRPKTEAGCGDFMSGMTGEVRGFSSKTQKRHVLPWCYCNIFAVHAIKKKDKRPFENAK
jgi:hypothetical protein